MYDMISIRHDSMTVTGNVRTMKALLMFYSIWSTCNNCWLVSVQSIPN